MRSAITIVRAPEMSAASVTRGDISVTPRSQALVVRWPGGGLVWNRPVAVVVEQNGQVKRLPIGDVTRGVQAGLLALGLAVAMLHLAQLLHHRQGGA
jgi:hypothetical protein